jgi:alpha-tubulin suppressor-like RCC1 family protein
MISAGRDHSCAVTLDYLIMCWGRNEFGQGGFGGTKASASPQEVITRAVLETVTAGGEHSCATSPRGDGYCWGRGNDGQLGNSADENMTVPAQTWGRTGYREIRAGGRHTCALWKETRMVCWGANERGQLGNASRTGSRVAMDIRMAPKIAFIRVALGDSHSCGLTDTGDVHCWGDNTDGQLGTGKGGKMDVSPKRVQGAYQFKSLTASGNSTCGMLENGEIYCWGSNASDQFGGGPAEGSRSPVRAAQAFPVTSVHLGGNHACGLDAQGNAYCWGKGMQGIQGPTDASAGAPRQTAPAADTLEAH